MDPSEPKAPVIRAVADLDGRLLEVPPCDVFCLVGNIVSPSIQDDRDAARDWPAGPFAAWLKTIPADVVACPAPGDAVWSAGSGVDDLDLGWQLLQDAQTTAAGLTIHGASSIPAWPGFVVGQSSLTALSVGFGVIGQVDLLLVSLSPFGGDSSPSSEAYFR
jgi:hypothetical protein